MSATIADSPRASDRPARRQPVALVFCCTILGAGAQVLMKTGANQITHPGLLGMIGNLPLLGGYCLYGFSTLLLVIALKDGELSLLYPVIALTYVWVTVLSFLIFHDDINQWKLLGIALIVSGVGVLGQREPALKTPISHMLLVLVASIFGSIGAAFLKYGAQELRRGWVHLFNWRLAMGVLLFLISSYFFVLGLRPPGELSVLYPMVAVSYIWTLIWSRIFFKEAFTRHKIIGLLLIVAGVCCVGAGGR